MSRWVEPKRPGLVAESHGAVASERAERIVKYVPAEVLAAYTGLVTALEQFNILGTQKSFLAALLVVVFLLVTIGIIAKSAPKEGGVKRAHLIVSPLAFVAWSYNVSAHLLSKWFVPWLAFSLLAITVALSLLIVPREN